MENQAEAATTPILKSKNNFFLSSNFHGFTLIEVMVVMAIIAAVMALGVNSFRRQETNLRQTLRTFSVLGKEIRNHSRLKNTYHRLAFKIGEKETSYRVEYAPSLKSVEQLTKENAEQDSNSQNASEFREATYIMKKPKILPSSLVISKIQSRSQKEPITSGDAYIYFSPEGMIEESCIQLGIKDRPIVTFYFNPLTGIAEVVNKPVDLHEIFDVEK